jgi:hypothetical protein
MSGIRGNEWDTGKRVGYMGYREMSWIRGNGCGLHPDLIPRPHPGMGHPSMGSWVIQAWGPGHPSMGSGSSKHGVILTLGQGHPDLSNHRVGRALFKRLTLHYLRSFQATIENRRMSVDLNLATLMRVIEDAQDKMPEGEYLAAMNALGALHRVVPVPGPVPGPGPAAAAAPVARGGGRGGGVLFGGEAVARSGGDGVPVRVNWRDIMGQESYNVWCNVKFKLAAYKDLSGEAWMGLTQEEQNDLNRRSIEAFVEMCKKKFSNPDRSVIPFISRHSVGAWGCGEEHSTCMWTCVCGYRGKSEHWKKHELSERHQAWAAHRTVSRRTVVAMRKQVERDEAGQFAKFLAPLTGGIRFFTTLQDRNEWVEGAASP